MYMYQDLHRWACDSGFEVGAFLWKQPSCSEELEFQPDIWQGLCCLGGRYLATGVVEGRIVIGHHGRMYSIALFHFLFTEHKPNKHKPHI